MAVRTINFEVYSLQGTRWNFHAHFDGDKREKALEEAQTIEKYPNVDGAVVVRESYSASDGDSSESIIYHTPSMKNKPSVAAISGGKAAPPKKAAPQSAAKAAAPKKEAAKKSAAKEPKAGALPKPPKPKVVESEDLNIFGIIFAFIIATIAGALASIGVYLVMRAVDVFLGRNLTLGILIGVFICTFLLLFVPKLKKILASSTTRRVVQAEPVVQELSVPMDGSVEPAAVQTAPTSAETSQDTIGDEGGTEKNAQETNGSNTDQSPSDDLTRSQSAASDLTKKAGLSREEAIEVCDQALAKIINDSKSLVGDAAKTDAYLRFGLVLYMAGANEELKHIHNLDDECCLELLISNVTKLDLPKEQAKGFCTNIDEYLLDEKYFDMYAAGRNNQIKHASQPGVKSNLEESIQTWRFPELKKQKPKSRRAEREATPDAEPERKFVAVLFTDIVNSTHNQQTKGEEWMMQVIRAHNDIIREAIARYAGQEIKHTGDGIMASFPAVVNSVEAGLAMQKGVMRFSEAMKTMAFQIRIGISAGEPIHENGDLFGTPVNMAARVMDKAGAEHVAVSGIVMEMCRGKPFKFESVGEFELKGFEEAQAVYRVTENK